MTARQSSTLIEEQPSLWGDQPHPDSPPSQPSPAQRPTPKRLRNHALGLPRPWPRHVFCTATCLRCRQPEGDGLCPGGCAIVCGRPTPLDKKDGKAPVEVCLLTLVLPARRISRYAVVLCPHCDGTHWHIPAPGRHYRVGQCGQPYIVHLPEETMNVVDDFRGPHEALSNFAPIPVTIHSRLENRDIEYPTGEHAFNAAKTTHPVERAAILAAPTPGEAKRIGQRVTLRPGWDERVRYSAMKVVVDAKFAPGTPAAAVLLSTGDAQLVEGNTWHDQHWGDCRCGRASCDSPGANHLGRLLMQRRAELREAVL